MPHNVLHSCLHYVLILPVVCSELEWETILQYTTILAECSNMVTALLEYQY